VNDGTCDKDHLLAPWKVEPGARADEPNDVVRCDCILRRIRVVSIGADHQGDDW
jgi:hypothetical protein